MPADDIRNIFDPGKNSILKKGKAQRWLAYDQYNLCAGRIAAFYRADAENGQLGFFESIDDEQVAHKLFKTAIKWLASEGCRDVTGPVNFGEKDRYWGLLTEGFNSKGLYLDNFNPAYYRSFFNSFGFSEADSIFTYKLNRQSTPFQKLNQVADWSEKKFGYATRHFRWEEKEEFATCIHSIYTAAFKEEKRISHLTKKDILHLLNHIGPLLNEKHCWFALQNGHPLGFILFLKEPTIPGKATTEKEILKGFAFATIPCMRGKGVEISLCRTLYQQLEKENKEYEIVISGINATTKNMHSLIKKIGGIKIKVHQTFTYKINL